MRKLFKDDRAYLSNVPFFSLFVECDALGFAKDGDRLKSKEMVVGIPCPGRAEILKKGIIVLRMECKDAPFGIQPAPRPVFGPAEVKGDIVYVVDTVKFAKCIFKPREVNK